MADVKPTTKRGLDHGTGHFAPLRSLLRLAVVDAEVLVVEEWMAQSPQTSHEETERTIAPLRLSHLTTRGNSGGSPSDMHAFSGDLSLKVGVLPKMFR